MKWDSLKKLLSSLDARDYFVVTGLSMLFIGLSTQFSWSIAMTVIGAIISAKGLLKWA